MLTGAVHSLTGSASLERLLKQVADKPVLLARLACLLLEKGHGERARELCARAVALAPHNGEVRTIAAQVLSHNVPDFYFPMVRDGLRHRAYEKALHRAIRPDSHVLDIGSGTGLFAMMAARAGAAAVVTCEANPAVAAVVSEVIVRNDLAGRVRVVAKHSADLEIGVDLPRPADVLIWDNLSNNMIGAGALPTMEQAIRRLTRRGAPAIPARGVIRAALAEDREADRKQMHIVEGFDLSAFNQLAPASYLVRNAHQRLALCSDPGDLFRFDFQSGGPFPEARAEITLLSQGGKINGVVQWVRFELDDEGSYENLPFENATSCFSVLFYPFPRAIETSPNDVLTVRGAHDRQSLRIWVENSAAQ